MPLNNNNNTKVQYKGLTASILYHAARIHEQQCSKRH
jgi:hypothetical protein